MGTDSVTDAYSIDGQAADVEAPLKGRFPLQEPLTFKHRKGLQPWPLFGSMQATGLIKNIATARFQPSMVLFYCFGERVRGVAGRMGTETGPEVLDGLGQLGLI